MVRFVEERMGNGACWGGCVEAGLVEAVFWDACVEAGLVEVGLIEGTC
ncbi:hypothetical protein [Bartonella sp. AP57NXGY]